MTGSGVNPIRRRTDMRPWTFGTDSSGRVRRLKRWFAVCPDCDEVVEHSGLLASRPTRKNTKDALHQHRLKRHG